MPRFSLPSEAKTRKAERNEQNPAATSSVYTPACDAIDRREARLRQRSPDRALVFSLVGLPHGPGCKDTGLSDVDVGFRAAFAERTREEGCLCRRSSNSAARSMYGCAE